MKKLTVFIGNDKKELYLDACIYKPNESIMTLKNAAIYWNYRNITADDNDHIMNGSSKILFEEGYWTFEMIKQRLAEDKIKLQANRLNNTCKIYLETSNLNLKKFAGMLGFAENEVISSGTWKTSPNVVDVNRGLRYININCDLVDTFQNSNTNGGRSCALATLSIPTDQLLNSTVSHYKDIGSQDVITNGCFNRLYFDRIVYKLK